MMLSTYSHNKKNFVTEFIMFHRSINIPEGQNNNSSQLFSRFVPLL